MTERDLDEIRRQATALGPWFHNIDLGGWRPRRIIFWATTRR